MTDFELSELELEEVDSTTLQALIEESENAFLPSSSNPAETTFDLFQSFGERFQKGEDHIYQPLAYIHDGKPISYIVALYYKANIIAIGPMYVASAYRGMGLGARQVSDFIEYVKMRRFESIFTKTWSKNSASIRIFTKLGFERIGIKANDRANGDSTIKYLLEL